VSLINQENKSTESTATVSGVVEWRVVVEEKKNCLRLYSFPVQRAIYKLLRNTFSFPDPFFMTMRETFEILSNEILTEQDVNRF